MKQKGNNQVCVQYYTSDNPFYFNSGQKKKSCPVNKKQKMPFFVGVVLNTIVAPIKAIVGQEDLHTIVKR